ncbi:MAG: hypothetical protein SFT81_05690 [Candidatus Caenarcaniphilales bacterium]|nr:hypothetical protein [Candidatus Caenarcaniphilales bacterium]
MVIFIGTNNSDIFFSTDTGSNNSFDGLGGNDTLSYENACVDISIDVGNRQVDTNVFTDTFANIERIITPGGVGSAIFAGILILFWTSL